MMPASAIIVSTATNPPSAKAAAPPATPALPPRKVQALTMPEPWPACSGERADSASRGASGVGQGQTRAHHEKADHQEDNPAPGDSSR